MSSCHHDDTLHRRDVLCGGGAALFGTLVASLLGGAKPARAEAIAGAVPEVDRVAVRVVIDSYQFAVAPSAKAGRRRRSSTSAGASADQPPGRTLISEFGLSMHVESRRGDETRHVLIDFGFTPEALTQQRRAARDRPGRARRARAEPRPLRPLRRPRRLPAPDQGPAEAQAPVLRRRRGGVLRARVDRAAAAGRTSARSTARRSSEADAGRDLRRAAGRSSPTTPSPRARYRR